MKSFLYSGLQRYFAGGKMSYCWKCGAELGEDERFCPKCGAPITGPAIAEVKPAKEFGRRNLWIGLALVAIVIVAVVGAAWMFSPLFSPLGKYKAYDTKSYGGMVPVDKVYLEVDNFNGPIRVSTWDNAEYKIDLTIEARGTSQENAEDYLKDLKINFDESVVQGEKRLILNYDVPFLAHSRYAIEVNAVLPADAMIDLDLDSSNGAIYLTDVEGGTLRMKTSNGRLVFDDVYAESITGETSNGRIEGDVEARDTDLSTSNGKISLTIPCTVSGEYDLVTTNGDMKLTVSSSTEVGYDLDLSTSNGDIDINLSGLNYSVNQKTSKKAQTEGFSGKTVQIILEASTSNGNIDVDTS